MGSNISESCENDGANMQKPLFCTSAAALALACCSCGHSPNLYPVTGKVLVKGAPAAGATVFFQRRGADLLNEHTIMGVVGAGGSFNLVCGPYGEGAPPGKYDVFVEWRHRAERAKGPLGSDRLKGHYADRNHPRLHAVVNAEPTDLPPFDLTEVTVTQADLKEPEPGHGIRGLRGKKPGIYIDGKPVDEETAKRIMREGPKGKKIQVIGRPGDKPLLFGPGMGGSAPNKQDDSGKSFFFKEKPGDGEPDQKKP
jgi:hypothetical protein